MHRHTLASVRALRYIISAADQGFPIVGDADPLGGGGTDLRYGRFSVKMCVKMKESGPVEGRIGASPRSAYASVVLLGPVHTKRRLSIDAS